LRQAEQGKTGKRSNSSEGGVTEGGKVYGSLVSDQRARLGLSRAELAARLHTSPSTVARIERGQPPSVELGDRLAAVLHPESPGGPLSRLIAWVGRAEVRWTLCVPFGSGWLRAGSAAGLLAALLLISGFTSRDLMLVARSSDRDRGASLPRYSMAVFPASVIPAAPRREREKPLTKRRTATAAPTAGELKGGAAPATSPLSPPSTPTTSVSGPAARQPGTSP
jgi:DNA-binding XRE family transcriptional regulator